MSTTNIDLFVRVLDTGGTGDVWTVAFHPDGKHISGGTSDGVLRWRLGDGQEVGRQMGMNMYAISVSKDRRWIVCGTVEGASVWDGEINKKLIDVEVRKTVWAVDVSPDSTRFATATDKQGANIWSITTGQRLIGPFKHDSWVTGIRFSPSGELVATAYAGGSVDIFDSRRGDGLVSIKIDIPDWVSTPLAWSSDGEQIFAASRDNKIRSFNVSTGSQLAESQILLDRNEEDVRSIALAANSKFIAAFAWHSISFLDTSTLTQIGSFIEDSEQIESIAISADSSYLATGQEGGKIAIRRLSELLPDLYGPFHGFIITQSRNKSRRKTKHPNKDDSHSAGHGAADTREVDPVQQATDPSQPSVGGVHLAHEQQRGISTLSISFPTWILCFCSGAHDTTS